MKHRVAFISSLCVALLALPAAAKEQVQTIRYGSDGTLISPLPQIYPHDRIRFQIEPIEGGLDVARHLFWLRYQCVDQPTDWMVVEFEDGSGPLRADVEPSCVPPGDEWSWEIEASTIDPGAALDEIAIHRTLHPALEAYEYISTLAYSKLSRRYYQLSNDDWRYLRGYMRQADFWARSMETASYRHETVAECVAAETADGRVSRQDAEAKCVATCATLLGDEIGVATVASMMCKEPDTEGFVLAHPEQLWSEDDLVSCELAKAPASAGDDTRVEQEYACLERCVLNNERNGVGRAEAAMACGDIHGLTVQDIIDEATFDTYQQNLLFDRTFSTAVPIQGKENVSWPSKPMDRESWFELHAKASDVFWEVELWKSRLEGSTRGSGGDFGVAAGVGGKEGEGDLQVDSLKERLKDALNDRNPSATTSTTEGSTDVEPAEEASASSGATEDDSVVTGEEPVEEATEEGGGVTMIEATEVGAREDEEKEPDELTELLREWLLPRQWISRGTTVTGRRSRVVSHDVELGRFSPSAPAIDDHDRVWVALANSTSTVSFAAVVGASEECADESLFMLNTASSPLTRETGEARERLPLPSLPLRAEQPDYQTNLWSLGKVAGNSMVQYSATGASEDGISGDFVVAKTYHIGLKAGLVGSWIKDRELSFSASDPVEGSESGSIVYTDGTPPHRRLQENYSAEPIVGLAFYLVPHDPLYDARRERGMRWVPHFFMGWAPNDGERSYLGLGFEPYAGFSAMGGVALGYGDVLTSFGDDEWKIDSELRAGGFVGLTLDVAVIPSLLSAVFPGLARIPESNTIMSQIPAPGSTGD